MADSPTPPIHGHINWWGTIPIWLIHLLPFLAFFTGVPWWNWVLMGGLDYGRMFFTTAGYHRYFAHRSYRTSRVMQFILAFGISFLAVAFAHRPSLGRGGCCWRHRHRRR